MSTLGAVLQGMDRGVMNGLNLYKTVQDEARQKRLDARQERRDALEDARYREEREYRDTRDTVMDARDERNHKWEQDKYKLESERLAAAAAATAAYRSAQLDISRATYNLKAKKQHADSVKAAQKEWQGKLDNGFEAYATAFKDNPDAAQDLYARDVHARIAVNKRVAEARGAALDDKTAAELYAMPRPDGNYVVGRNTEKGFVPYDADPDTDGEQALVMPADTFARMMAGTEGSQSLEAKNAQAGAQQQVVDARNAQYNADNADILARAAEAEQTAFRAEDELATLSKAPVYVTSTDYRGQKVTRFNPALREMGYSSPEQVETAKRTLSGQVQQAQGDAAQLIPNQKRAETSAAEGLSRDLGYLDQATQGVDNAEAPAALSNTLLQIRADNGQTVRPGKTPEEALKLNNERSMALYNAVGGIVSKVTPKTAKEREFFKASAAKMQGSIVAAAEQNGGLDQWLASPTGIAGVGEIAAQMADRGIDYGAGFLAKTMAMQRKGVQIEAGLDALQNKVVQSLPAQDREPIALLASEIIGRDTDDPEAAIMKAIEAYGSGQRPKTLADAGR